MDGIYAMAANDVFSILQEPKGAKRDVDVGKYSAASRDPQYAHLRSAHVRPEAAALRITKSGQ